MSLKLMNFLFFPFFAQLDECLEKGVHFSSEAHPKTGDEKEQEELGELS